MPRESKKYSARYCVDCGSLAQWVNGNWKCPVHGDLVEDIQVTTEKPE